MLRDMKLGIRLVLGVGLILLLMLIVGFSGYFGLTRVLNMTEFYRTINELQQTVSGIKEQTDQYFLSTYSGQQDLQQNAITATLDHLENGLVIVDGIKNKLGNDAEGGNDLDRFVDGLNSYKGSFNEFVQTDQNIAKFTDEIKSSYNQISAQIKKSDLWTEKMAAAGSVLSGTITSYLAENSERNWSKIQDASPKFRKSVDDYAALVETSDELRPIADNIKRLYQTLSSALDDHHELVLEQQGYIILMDQNKKSLDEICAHLGKISTEKLQNQTGFSLKIIMTSLVIAFLIGVTFAAFSVKTIVGSMRKVISHVSQGAQHTLSVAGQVSSASQSLAAGSSEQAASIEETSSSLEDITNVTKLTAKNALEANNHMQTANQLVQKANRVMDNLTGSMGDISKSSEETHNIVKKIDEIAFQTNLLALNAAVEAARAGEAGSGFAVVADEVRNLAMRAADAAKDTADLIEATVKKIQDGSDLVTETHDAFAEVAGSVSKAGELVNEISSATEEQAQKIEQVNHAVLEMDRVTQQNAANAEESAGASEELNVQAEQMKSTIDELGALVGEAETVEALAEGDRDLLVSEKNFNQAQ
jgi:methyl-accepting chemotaxis protein